jgi:RNA polymerase sigma-70 factor (ECF subfamily)
MAVTAELLVRDYGNMVSSVCHRMIQDVELAQDAAQQTWMEIIKSLPGFREEAKISTWIYSIAKRTVMDCCRNERQYTTAFLHDYFRDGERELPQTENFDKELWVKEMCDKCLTGMLHCLDNETRLVYIFKDIVQLSYEEIAQVLELDEPTIRQIVSRTRKKLKSFLNNECALANPGGDCHCRMKRWVEQVDLPGEYEKLRNIARQSNIFLESEKILPKKNYWITFI